MSRRRMWEPEPFHLAPPDLRQEWRAPDGSRVIQCAPRGRLEFRPVRADGVLLVPERTFRDAAEQLGWPVAAQATEPEAPSAAPPGSSQSPAPPRVKAQPPRRTTPAKSAAARAREELTRTRREVATRIIALGLSPRAAAKAAQQELGCAYRTALSLVTGGEP